MLTLTCFTKLDVVFVCPDMTCTSCRQCWHLAFILPSAATGTSKWPNIVYMIPLYMLTI